MPETKKDIVLKDKVNAKNLVMLDHQIVRKCQISNLKDLLVKSKIYVILVDKNTVKLIEQDYVENLFETSQFNR